ncbi:MAG: TolC family protein, partial [Pseudomonadales bacterium]|nr:TolC family protein [Pseudomonadales bacterium]
MRLLPAALGLAISMAFVPHVAAENILEIFDDAVRNDLVMRAARAELRAGQENVKIARSALLPQIGFDATLSDSEIENEFDNPNDIVVDGTVSSNRKNWGIALQQTLFDMSKWYDFKAGQKLSEQAEISFLQSQQKLIVRTTQAYLDVLRAHNNLESSIAEEKAVKQQLDQTQQR